nr:hypothetical protein BaRGS_017218 [Batillaria attramentaria]
MKANFPSRNKHAVAYLCGVGGGVGGNASRGLQSPPSSFIPRPGLLNLQHPSLVQSSGAAHPLNLYPAHPIFGYGGGQGVSVAGMGVGTHNPMSVLSGSAFHSPADQALKLAQLQGLSYAEWLARTGMYVSRMVDYSPSCE